MIIFCTKSAHLNIQSDSIEDIFGAILQLDRSRITARARILETLRLAQSNTAAYRRLRKRFLRRARAFIIGRRRREKHQKHTSSKPTWRKKGSTYSIATMGQESSTLVDERTPPQTLKSRTVESVARLIKNGRAKKIVVMVWDVMGLVLGTKLANEWADRRRH